MPTVDEFVGAGVDQTENGHVGAVLLHVTRCMVAVGLGIKGRLVRTTPTCNAVHAELDWRALVQEARRSNGNHR